MKWEKFFLETLKNQYQAKMDKALANLSVFAMNPAGIGEHGNVVEEAMKCVEEYDHARSCVESLESLEIKYEE